MLFRAFALAILAMTACSNENTRIKGNFLSACIQAGSTKDVCVCSFDKIEQHYSPKEFRALMISPTREFMEFGIQKAAECRAGR